MSADDKECVLFEVVHGSQAFGLSGPDSDVDLKGVIVGPLSWYSGFLDAPEQIQLSKDHTRYDIRKFFRLAADTNPTAIEMLWAPDDCVKIISPLGERIISYRQDFLSQRVADSFGNYAISQLKRIKTHRRWLLNPPKAEPKRSDFKLPEKSLISNDQMGAADALIERGDISDDLLSPNFLLILDRERSYRVARREWEHYHAWKRERNPVRAKQEEKFGYDTKHAQHLVRLLRMSFEILSTGQVIVRRPDREDLLEIKQGAWEFDKLIEYAEHMHEKVREARNMSSLPEDSDREKLNEMCSEIVREARYR
ncbi:MAG: nucleotidyltransferase domain-containing protein [Candidatus Ozemobacteraceae bacterium]